MWGTAGPWNFVECQVTLRSLITPCDSVCTHWPLAVLLEGVVKLRISLTPNSVVLAFTLNFANLCVMIQWEVSSPNDVNPTLQ